MDGHEIKENVNSYTQSQFQIYHTIYDDGIVLFCIKLGETNTELVYGGNYDNKRKENLLKKFEQSVMKDPFIFPDSNVYVSKQGSQISIYDDGKGLRPHSVTVTRLEERAIKLIFTNIEKFCIDYKKELEKGFIEEPKSE